MITGWNLRDRVEIQTQSSVQDSFGQKLETWSTLAQLWANVTPYAMGEVTIAGAPQHITKTRMVIRWRAGLKTDMRVVFKGNIYKIIGLRDFEERTEYIELITVGGGAYE